MSATPGAKASLDFRRRVQEASQRLYALEAEQGLVLEIREGLTADERALRAELDSSQRQVDELGTRVDEATLRALALDEEAASVKRENAALELSVGALEQQAMELEQEAAALERRLSQSHDREGNTQSSLVGAVERLGRLGQRLRGELGSDPSELGETSGSSRDERIR